MRVRVCEFMIVFMCVNVEGKLNLYILVSVLMHTCSCECTPIRSIVICQVYTCPYLCVFWGLCVCDSVCVHMCMSLCIYLCMLQCVRLYICVVLIVTICIYLMCNISWKFSLIQFTVMCVDDNAYTFLLVYQKR